MLQLQQSIELMLLPKYRKRKIDWDAEIFYFLISSDFDESVRKKVEKLELKQELLFRSDSLFVRCGSDLVF